MLYIFDERVNGLSHILIVVYEDDYDYDSYQYLKSLKITVYEEFGISIKNYKYNA